MNLCFSVLSLSPLGLLFLNVEKIRKAGDRYRKAPIRLMLCAVWRPLVPSLTHFQSRAASCSSLRVPTVDACHPSKQIGQSIRRIEANRSKFDHFGSKFSSLAARRIINSQRRPRRPAEQNFNFTLPEGRQRLKLSVSLLLILPK